MMNSRKNLFVFTLRNGIRVLAYRIPSYQSVTLEVKTLGGRAYEPVNQKGIAHFTEHIIGASTPSHKTKKDFFIYLESFAGWRNLYTNMYFISLECRAPAAHLHRLISLGYEIFFRPLFTQEAIDIDRSAIINEIKQKEENPNTKLYRFWTRARFRRGTVLYNETLPMLAASKTVQRPALISYWKRVANPRNMYLLVSGNFNIQQLRKQLRATFGKEGAKSPALRLPKVTPHDLKADRIAIHYLPDYSNVYVDLSFRAAGMRQDIKTRIHQIALQNILGGFFTSRLYKLLRLEKGLVYSIGINHSLYHPLGFINIDSRVEKEKLDTVLEHLFRELRSFYDTGPTVKELENAKRLMNNSRLMKHDDPQDIMNWLRGDFLWEKRVRFPKDYIRMTNAMTLRALKATMRKYWDFSRLQLCIQGNIKDTPQNRRKYLKLLNRYFPR